jgi:uncharacterized membrane protein SpoIIM required for sporulation
LGSFLALKFLPLTIVQKLSVHPNMQSDAWSYISHNLGIEVTILAGMLTLGVGTFIILVLNGLLTGIFATTISLHYGTYFLLAGLLPHGIPEALAWIIAGACSFLMSKHFRLFVFRKKVTDGEATIQMKSPIFPSVIWKIYGLLTIVATSLIIVAGFLEAYVSPLLIPVTGK